jgi:hypothetical protein
MFWCKGNIPSESRGRKHGAGWWRRRQRAWEIYPKGSRIERQVASAPPQSNFWQTRPPTNLAIETSKVSQVPGDAGTPIHVRRPIWKGQEVVLILRQNVGTVTRGSIHAIVDMLRQ